MKCALLCASLWVVIQTRYSEPMNVSIYAACRTVAQPLYSDSNPGGSDASPNSAPAVPCNVFRCRYNRRLCAVKPLGHTRRQNSEVHDRHGAQVGRRRLREQWSCLRVI